jgi:hypothetical protein
MSTNFLAMWAEPPFETSCYHMNVGQYPKFQPPAVSNKPTQNKYSTAAN